MSSKFTVSCISDGMHYGWTAPIIPRLLEEDTYGQVTKQQAEWLETIYMLGSCCGIPLTIFLIERLGRNTLIYSSSVTALSWLIMAVAPSMWYLYVARFFAGLGGDAGFVAAPMYIAEVADHKNRGFLSSITYIMMLIGIVLVYSVAPFTPFWVPCLLGICFNAITLCSLPFTPESPYYLLYKNRPEEARRSLAQIRPDSDIEDELNEITLAIRRQKSEQGGLQDLILVKSNRKGLIIMVFLNAAQHMSSLSVMFMNLHSILDEGGAMYISSSTSGIIFSFTLLGAAMLASAVMDYFGRRILLMTSSMFTGLSLAALALYFSLKNSGCEVLGVSWIVPLAVLCYAVAFKLGLGMVPIVLTAELFPAKVKAIGMTVSDASYVVFSVISVQVYLQLKDAFGIDVPLYIFAGCCFLTVIFTFYYIPETKGKTLEEIQFILKDREKEKLISTQNGNVNYTRM